MTVIDNAPIGSSNSDDLRDELTVLTERRTVLSHDVAVHRAMGDLDNNDPYHRALESLLTVDRRMAELNALIAGSTTCTPVENGTAHVGSVVTVRFGDDDNDVETFTLVSSGILADAGVGDTCSSTSPLGAALVGSRAGDTRTYTLPTGSSCTVHVVGIA
ncbi:GreA/GreB family elongation factor [Rhodococcus sp. B10]|uniref:GreA/GreB family elongation factor n=1 Tax=Rhodococcus sp. B10 TaxID=2695876 RepID=UPI00143200D6|nr:GreA/GreB family elongation factor [Rhodococcus sp. B10]NIL74341.1 Transcription elongation factor GreA [Rhodococcus sp. B10]